MPPIPPRFQVVLGLCAAFPLLSGPAFATWSFTDVSGPSGAGVVHHVSSTVAMDQRLAGGVACGDYDNDGWIDLYHLGGNLGTNHLLHNNGDGTFTDVAAAAGVDLPGSWGAGATFADWNGDGWLDLFVGNVAPSRPMLFENDGDGTFTDVTDSCGVYLTLDTFSASFADIDGDGDLDMALSHWGAVQGPKHFWRNDGNGPFCTRFSAVDPDIGYTAFRGYPADYTFTYNFADLNDDGWPDFLCTSDYYTSQVYLNDCDGTFTDVTDTLVIYADNAMGASVADYDKDGDLDWFVTSIMNSVTMTKNGNRMYRNAGGGVFEDVTDEAGVRDGQWGWGASFQDFDNDGWLDIYHVNGWQTAQYDSDAAVLFLSDGDGTFTETAAALGVADTGQGRGIACFDYDRDGDIDIFVENCDQPAVLYRNDGGNAANWLDVKLVGPSPNTEQIGARITAVVGASRQLQELRAGNNFESQDPAEAHFGLGTAAQADSVLIRWTDGTVTTLVDVPANQRLVVEETDVPSVVAVPPAGRTTAYALSAPRPNPFRTATAVRLDLPEGTRVRLAVFDVRGRRVRTLGEGELPAGSHSVTWDGRDDAGRKAAAGVYFVRAQAGAFDAARRVVRLE